MVDKYWNEHCNKKKLQNRNTLRVYFLYRRAYLINNKTIISSTKREKKQWFQNQWELISIDWFYMRKTFQFQIYISHSQYWVWECLNAAQDLFCIFFFRFFSILWSFTYNNKLLANVLLCIPHTLKTNFKLILIKLIFFQNILLIQFRVFILLWSLVVRIEKNFFFDVNVYLYKMNIDVIFCEQDQMNWS